MSRRALITGITGQDGSFLAELLVEKGYEVFGLVRRSSTDTLVHIKQFRLQHKVNIIHGDIRDKSAIVNAVEISKPDEIYNLASQSHVGMSFDCPEETYAVNFQSAQWLFEIATVQNSNIKIYQASSSEIFGNVQSPQNEQSDFNPQTPYGESKLKAHLLARELSQAQRLFIASGILYNHESERRAKNFVTRKITHSLTKIKLGLQENMGIGNIHSTRDWGYAKDYVQAMWLMLQQEQPEEFVIATGKLHSVKDFINETATQLELPLFWHGESLQEQALDANGKTLISINPDFYRQTEPYTLVGDASKAKKKLDWSPNINFKQVVSIMVSHELKTII